VGSEARAREVVADTQDHGEHRGARPGLEAARPGGRRAAERDRRERDDQQEAGQDEREAAGERASPPADALRAVDGELRRRRPREQLCGRVRILELPGVDPAASLDAQLAQERHVGRRPAESDDAQAPPLARDRAQADPFPRHSTAHGVRSGEALV